MLKFYLKPKPKCFSYFVSRFFIFLLGLLSVTGYSQTDSTTQEQSTPPAPAVEVAESPVPEVKKADKTISGKITDNVGEPVIGAIVTIKDTKVGAATDADGAFSILVSEENVNGTLVISYVGYKTVELPIATTTSFDVTLFEDEKILDEVVVIGYGTQENKDVTGAVSVVSSKDINKVVNVDATQSIQGRSPGVAITQNTGAPGASVQVRVRGIGSASGSSNPLYLVNGVPVADLSFLNSNDIENITVLKDASATAIYGNRGANGVVLVTTKMGSTKKTTFDFNVLHGISKAWKKLDLLDAKEWATLKNESLLASGKTPTYSTNDLGEGTNWQDQIFTTGKMNNYSLSASGASEKSNYFLSGAYLNQSGIVKNSNYERYSFSGNHNVNVGKRLTIGLYSNVAFYERLEANDNGNGFSSVIGNALVMDPLTSVNIDRGTDSTYAPSLGDAVNPVALINNRIANTKGMNFVGNAFGEYKFLKYFKYKSNVGFNYSNSTFSEFQNKYFIKSTQTRAASTVVRDQNQSNSLVWSNAVSFEKKIGTDHKVEGLVLMEYLTNRSEYIRASRDNTRNNYSSSQYISAGVDTTAKAENSASENAMLSYMARGAYEFKGRYLLTATMRRDESSRFPKANRVGYFPSFSLGWKVSEEAFFKVFKPVVTFMKIRTGYGKVGNQNISGINADYPGVTTLSDLQKYSFNGNVVRGTSPLSQGNKNVTWEKVTTSNVAIDLGFLRERILFTVDYFVKTTDDMLIKRQVPYMAGLEESPFVNGGKMENKGVELSALYRNSTKGLGYSVGGNITFIKNKVLSYGLPYNDGAFREYNVNITQEGSSVAEFYGYQTDGIVQTQEEANALKSAQPYVQPGDFKFKDLNGDGVINAQDQTTLGSPIPKFTYGFNADLTYKSFDLTMFFQGSYGNKIYNGTKYFLESSSMAENFNKSNVMLDRWTGPGTSNEIPRVSEQDQNVNGRVSNYFIESGSYLRLKVLQIGYTLPERYISRLKMEKIRVFVGAQNLLTFTKYSGFDPEIGQNVNNISGQRFASPTDFGVDRGGTYPQARTWQFGINASF